MTSQVTAFLARRWRVPASSLDVELQPLDGGLESMVARARVGGAQAGSGVPRDLVVKQLSGGIAREADVYDAIWRHLDRPPAVQMFGRDVCGDATYLYRTRGLVFYVALVRDRPLGMRLPGARAVARRSPSFRRSVLVEL